MNKRLASALVAGLAATVLAAPASAQMRTSAGTAATGDVSVARKVGTILTNSGLLYAPRYVPAGNLEFGAGLGVVSGGINSVVPIAGLTGYVSDGLNWGLMLSGESQFGLRQRYMATDKISFGGSYLGRLNLLPGAASPTVGDYGATYRLEYLMSQGGLDFYFQPEFSYYVNAGPAAALALGADYWIMPSFSLGLGAQTNMALGTIPATGRFENRVGAGAKLFASDDAFGFLSAAYLIDRAATLATVGAGYRFR